MYDLLIEDGLVIDGTGSAPYKADVAARSGDIVAIGWLARGAARRSLCLWTKGPVRQLLPGCSSSRSQSSHGRAPGSLHGPRGVNPLIPEPGFFAELYPSTCQASAIE